MDSGTQKYRLFLLFDIDSFLGLELEAWKDNVPVIFVLFVLPAGLVSLVCSYFVVLLWIFEITLSPLVYFLAISPWWLFVLIVRSYFCLYEFIHVRLFFFYVVCDGKDVARIASYSFAELIASVNLAQVICIISFVDLEQVVLQVWKSVGLEVSEVNDVVFILEFVAERESVQSHHLWCFVFELVACNTFFVEFVVGSAFSLFSS